jgi:hypothetical protein
MSTAMGWMSWGRTDPRHGGLEMPRSHAASRCNTGLTLRQSAGHFAGTAAATRTARSAPRSTCVILREFW